MKRMLAILGAVVLVPWALLCAQDRPIKSQPIPTYSGPTTGTLRTISIPTVDISADARRHVVVARGTQQDYHGHCDTVLMADVSRRIGDALLDRQQREDQALRITAYETSRVGFGELISEQLIEKTRIDRGRGGSGCFVHDSQIRTDPLISANINPKKLNSYDFNCCSKRFDGMDRPDWW
jgi:hypothetical protein